MSVDYYLYNFSLYPAQIIIKSSQSYQLLDKKYFTGNLQELNFISLAIIDNYLKKNNIYPNNPTGKNDIDALKNIIKILKKKDNNISNSNYIKINGENYFIGPIIDK